MRRTTLVYDNSLSPSAIALVYKSSFNAMTPRIGIGEERRRTGENVRVGIERTRKRSQGWFTWSPTSQVPLMLASPNMEAKSQLLNLKKPLKYG